MRYVIPAVNRLVRWYRETRTRSRRTLTLFHLAAYPYRQGSPTVCGIVVPPHPEKVLWGEQVPPGELPGRMCRRCRAAAPRVSAELMAESRGRLVGRA